MTAVIYNTVIDQGADWSINFTYQNPNGTPVNLTGYTAALQLRSFPDAPTAVLSLSTANGGITITAQTGVIAVRATATQTGSIIAGTYDYDLEIYSANATSTTRLSQGQIVVSAQVTR
jgi:hypothetical protein